MNATSINQHAPRADQADEQLRERVHGMWSSVAASWGQHADYVDARASRITERLLGAAALRSGERVLELACGPGGVGIAAARLVAPGGRVVLSDVAPEMIQIAQARARTAGLSNVSVKRLDVEAIDEPDDSFDVVLCRDGLMFALDPARAAREIARVLAPGGRFAIAVWGPQASNPWLGVVFQEVSAHLGIVVPPPGIPGPFALQDADRLARLFADAGLRDVAVERLATPLAAKSFEDWWDRTSALAGPLGRMLTALPPDTARDLRTRLRKAVEPYETAAGLEFPGQTLVATGRRA